jgi:hypothetical protein
MGNPALFDLLENLSEDRGNLARLATDLGRRGRQGIHEPPSRP